MLTARGKIVKGHQVASGSGGDARFPDGTIRPQLPFFRVALPGFDNYFDGPVYPGTINLNFPGRVLNVRKPEYFLMGVCWTDLFPPENFYLSPCAIVIGGRTSRGLLYIPDAATKPDHAQPSGTVEILCSLIPDLRYGDIIDLLYSPEAICLG